MEKIWNVLVFIVAMIVAIGVGLMLYVSGFAGVGFSGRMLHFDFHGGNTSGPTILFIELPSFVLWGALAIVCFGVWWIARRLWKRSH
ncbi:hypothetical protein CA54_18320 [Symmachiella macrocystis]|uniref:Uncharacterized protein n=1 Tax=Symmachiella macrocystis TaxID=2527985 RepID=A0A5C6BP09_9PLAN|nr:hypothetical protein [Symmachiella macrocystis]TWU13006.1 hypothetical protein CA54_18320 [Symmachiella macrocystis]